MANDKLASAVKATREVLARVDSDQLHQPTPCAKWDVGELINHLVGVPTFFAAVVDGETLIGDPPDYATGDFLAAFEVAGARCVDAYADEAVLDKVYDLPIGKFPGSVCLSITTSDTFVHGWDLAKATGQRTDLDPTLAAQILSDARSLLPAEYRNEAGDPFGFEKPAPSGASPADQLAAFMGRDV